MWFEEDDFVGGERDRRRRPVRLECRCREVRGEREREDERRRRHEFECRCREERRRREREDFDREECDW